MSKKYLRLAGAVFCGLFTCVHSVIADHVSNTNTLTIQPLIVSGLRVNYAGTFDDPGNSYGLDSGPNPASVVSADVNGDGKMDLICANGEDELRVFTNDGSGGFVISCTLSVGSGHRPYQVAVADVNGDGKMDLISANNGNKTLTVFTNKGRGLFVLASTPGVGSFPFSVAAADVNGDGKIDLISCNRGDNTLTVLTNRGNGLFVSNATYTVGSIETGSDPRFVAAADVNGDGYADLISANYGGSTLTVLTNNGSGRFGSNATCTVGSAPTCVIAVDVNGDGHVDLVSANYGDGTLTVLTNDGSGNFVFSATLDVGSWPNSITAADVLGNGNIDLISANGDGTLSVLTNDGSGGFTLGSTVDAGGDWLTSVTCADVNGDSGMDLIFADYSAPNLTVWLNTLTSLGSLPGVAISWSTNGAAGFVLQKNDDLTTANWVNVSTPPTVTNHQNQVILVPLVDSEFYRLRHP